MKGYRKSMNTWALYWLSRPWITTFFTLHSVMDTTEARAPRHTRRSFDLRALGMDDADQTVSA